MLYSIHDVVRVDNKLYAELRRGDLRIYTGLLSTCVEMLKDLVP